MAITQTRTAHLQAIDAAHHIHPFCDPKSLAERGTRVITKADGCYVEDSDGNRILDGMAGLWCVNVGYGRQELVDVAARQMEELPFYNSFFQSSTPSQIALAERLSKITPGDLNHFFFANSGSEANDTVIRMARHYWHLKGKPEKYKFIGRHLGYHGSTLAATSLGGMKHMHDMGSSTLPGFEHIMEPHWFAHGGNLSPEQFALRAAQALEDKILEIGADNIAAFIGEPIQGAGGVISPPPGYWPEIERICRKHDILFVSDEVICGFGRLGEWFGCQYYGVQPDIMPMAKGMSSGYLPISAVAFSDRIFETLNEGGPISHGYTYSGHPVSCAVAHANIDIIEREGLVERVRNDIGPYLQSGLAHLYERHSIIGEVRGAQALAGLQLVRSRDTREPFAAEDNAAMICRDICLEKGLIMRAVGQAMVICPPLTITHAEIDEMIDKADAGLREAASRLGLD
ncbi:aspartate aminotransferase family protein [Henriciella pelagia]|jgi:putrescine---pyruvate transaminase|uniref:Aspartate aminotransferase family protein n=1 Tax=Henriciella pelagia TaxID=1977912 RepID=A0ABQ1K1A1_9PROT|nr:aspartate aminotransferase family protein [Henriciella pelagia]GGB80115.1 aspartate aminotransferase family protein [Henriciella pelagia]